MYSEVDIVDSSCCGCWLMKALSLVFNPGGGGVSTLMVVISLVFRFSILMAPESIQPTIA